MFLKITKRDPHWREKNFPEYFRQRWIQQKGGGKLNDPVMIQRVVDACMSMVRLTILIMVIGVVLLMILPAQRRNGDPLFLASFAVLATLTMLPLLSLFVGLVWADVGVSEFKRELAKFGQFLGRTPEQLGEIPIEHLRGYAVTRLKEMAKIILAIQAITGKEPHVAKEAVTSLMRGLYNTFVFWGFIKDTGWERYFTG